MPRVIEGAGFVQTKYPILPRTGCPESSTTSVAMPGAGAPNEHGFSDWIGNGNRKQPTISVPPEILMIGQRRFPIFSKNHEYDVSSHGSPVGPRSRSEGMLWCFAES